MIMDENGGRNGGRVKRDYKRVSQDARVQLINLLSTGHSIKDAALYVRINYESAKAINRQYRRKINAKGGKLFEKRAVAMIEFDYEAEKLRIMHEAFTSAAIKYSSLMPGSHVNE